MKLRDTISRLYSKTLMRIRPFTWYSIKCVYAYPFYFLACRIAFQLRRSYCLVIGFYLRGSSTSQLAIAQPADAGDLGVTCEPR